MGLRITGLGATLHSDLDVTSVMPVTRGVNENLNGPGAVAAARGQVETECLDMPNDTPACPRSDTPQIPPAPQRPPNLPVRVAVLGLVLAAAVVAASLAGPPGAAAVLLGSGAAIRAAAVIDR